METVGAKAKSSPESADGVVGEVMDVVERAKTESDMADLERDAPTPPPVRPPADNTGNAQPLVMKAGRRRPHKNRRTRRKNTPSPEAEGLRSQSNGSARGGHRLGLERRSPSPRRPFHDFMRDSKRGGGHGKSRPPLKKNGQ